MKKNLNLILALVLAVCVVLAGCGSDEPASGVVTPGTDTSATVPGGNVETAATTPAEETEAVEETTEPAPETTAPAEENSLSLGRMEGGVYTNEYVGFACQLDANWTFLSAEELQQIPDTVSDLMDGSELGEALEGVQQFTDMMAENVNDLTTMNVLYQKLTMQERLAYATMTEEAIVDAALAQRDMIIEAYTQAGMSVLSLEKVTVNFMGEERVAVRGAFTIQDVPYYTLQVFDYHLGSYSVTTTFASYVEDNTESLLELFYKVD